ncbi:radical SAM additional 4Fe4S-binding SPASM domain-containing protein [Lachnospiraceae bacterium NK3A20]|nr:radical SAM additional 4Fe4S-binding SPASM domain-containing protein [Lachnospiraceae bacterium NK3A20]
MFVPRTAVWEITMACNMRCKHCGSSCSKPLDNELTTAEALSLCDQLADLGLKRITLSGGEPTTRGDWLNIAERLIQNGITTSIITNGWSMSQEMVSNIKNVGLKSVAISLDGVKETHDSIRKVGSFEKSMNLISMLVEAGITVSAITTINKQNLDELDALFNILAQKGVYSWQLQFALPMGNFKNHIDKMIAPEDIKSIIDFAYSKIEKEPMIVLADCLGYYSKNSIQITERFLQDKWSWTGCGAGKSVIGILCDGSIVGCTSIRDRKLVAGNIRNQSLRSIWGNPDSFRWNREFSNKQLKGFCKECQYSEICKGGCSNSRYCLTGSFESENKYCSYNASYYSLKTLLRSFNKESQFTNLLERADGNSDFNKLISDEYRRFTARDSHVSE